MLKVGEDEHPCWKDGLDCFVKKCDPNVKIDIGMGRFISFDYENEEENIKRSVK